MTEAERFLQERLNPPKPRTPVAQTVVVEEATELPSALGFLAHPAFSRHRIFWSIGFVLVIALVDLLVMAATDAFEAINNLSYLDEDNAPALIVSLITPVTFWIPILLIARWAWNKTFTKVVSCATAVWMVIIHLCKIGALFGARNVSGGQIAIGIVVFLIGGLGIGAVLWNLIVNRNLTARPRALKHAAIQTRTYNIRIKCPACKKTFKADVDTAEALVSCPHCGNEKSLTDQEQAIKEPLFCQIVRALFYILAFFAFMHVIGSLFMITTLKPEAFAIVFFVCLLKLWLFCAIPSGIKKGANWARVVAILFVGIGLLMFFPGCNAWFAVKTMLRKSRENGKGESHVG